MQRFTKANVLINLTNHPSSKWANGQLEAARNQFGKVEDVPFPVIDPVWNAAQVTALVEVYAERCLDRLRHQPDTSAVHVMGEMTFTFALVKRLQMQGVRCVASTSERLSVPQPDGTRQVSFHFVRFRDYAMAGTFTNRSS